MFSILWNCDLRGELGPKGQAQPTATDMVLLPRGPIPILGDEPRRTSGGQAGTQQFGQDKRGHSSLQAPPFWANYLGVRKC